MIRETIEQDVRKLVEEWAAAERRGDTAFMQRTLTNDFMAIGPRGFQLTKDEWVQRFTSGSLRYDYLEFDETKVRLYGDAAVATGHERQKVYYQNQPMEVDMRVSLVFVKQQGQWLLAHVQMSPIMGRP